MLRKRDRVAPHKLSAPRWGDCAVDPLGIFVRGRDSPSTARHAFNWKRGDELCAQRDAVSLDDGLYRYPDRDIQHLANLKRNRWHTILPTPLPSTPLSRAVDHSVSRRSPRSVRGPELTLDPIAVSSMPTNHKRHSACAPLLGIQVLWLILVGNVLAEPYKVIYAFGDSYSDIGARFPDSDGPTAVLTLRNSWESQ